MPSLKQEWKNNFKWRKQWQVGEESQREQKRWEKKQLRLEEEAIET